MHNPGYNPVSFICFTPVLDFDKKSYTFLQTNKKMENFPNDNANS